MPHTVNFTSTNSVGPDGYVYFSAHGFAGGHGRNDWDKGDAIYLCRVRPGPENVTRVGAYEFFAGRAADGSDRWTKRVEESQPVLSWPNHLGSENIAWVPGLKKFILITCRLKETETNLPYNVTIFWEANRLTGPYRLVHYLRDWGPQAYFPNLPAAFIAPDGHSAWLCVSCNYSVPEYNPHQCRYAASLHEIYFDIAGRDLPPDPAPGRNIAPEARVTASTVEPGTRAEGVTDGQVSPDPARRWTCQEGPGSFLRLEWDTPRTIHKVRIWDDPSTESWTQEGYLTFDDGSIVWMHAPPSNRSATPAELNFPPRARPSGCGSPSRKAWRHFAPAPRPNLARCWAWRRSRSSRPRHELAQESRIVPLDPGRRRRGMVRLVVVAGAAGGVFPARAGQRLRPALCVCVHGCGFHARPGRRGTDPLCRGAADATGPPNHRQALSRTRGITSASPFTGGPIRSRAGPTFIAMATAIPKPNIMTRPGSTAWWTT